MNMEFSEIRRKRIFAPFPGREYFEYLGYLEENICTLFHKSALVENEHLVVTHHSVQPWFGRFVSIDIYW